MTFVVPSQTSPTVDASMPSAEVQVPRVSFSVGPVMVVQSSTPVPVQIPTMRADFSIGPGEEAWVNVPAGGVVTVTLLPEPAGQHARLKNLPWSGGNVLVVAADGVLIDGIPSYLMTPGSANEFDSDGESFAIF